MSDDTARDMIDTSELDSAREQLKLLADINKILFEEWDPLCIKDYGGGDDEYSSYALEILKMKLENESSTGQSAVANERRTLIVTHEACRYTTRGCGFCEIGRAHV